MKGNETYRGLKWQRDIDWSPCVYLLQGSLTLEQLKNEYRAAPFPGSPRPAFYMEGGWNRRGLEKLPDNLAGLVKSGWVIQDKELFTLTEHGHQEVETLLERARTSSKWVTQKLQALFQPELASKITLIMQITLALIKLPAGLLSGSIGLLNDSADTLLDLLSSLLVYLGIRFNKERAVSILLVVFMLGTGGLTLFEAVKRCFVPSVPKVDWFPFAAAILSALAGLFLWTYQRYVGIHNGLMAFITESVDSRNHIIVAISVTAGLVASLLHFGLLDMLVGLVVALLILWSAIQLLIDLVRSSGDEQAGFAHYGFWLLNAYQHLRDTHLVKWMLTLIDQQEVQTRSELMKQTSQAFDYRDNLWMKMVGLDREFANEIAITKSMSELFSHGWVLDQNPLVISGAGKEYLKRQKEGRWMQTMQKIMHEKSSLRLTRQKE